MQQRFPVPHLFVEEKRNSFRAVATRIAGSMPISDLIGWQARLQLGFFHDFAVNALLQIQLPSLAPAEANGRSAQTTFAVMVFGRLVFPGWLFFGQRINQINSARTAADLRQVASRVLPAYWRVACRCNDAHRSVKYYWLGFMVEFTQHYVFIASAIARSRLPCFKCCALQPLRRSLWLAISSASLVLTLQRTNWIANTAFR